MSKEQLLYEEIRDRISADRNPDDAAAFSNMETIHVAAYSHLLDTIGMPEVEYSAFLASRK